MRGGTWSDAEDALLIELWPREKPSYIAKIMDRTRNAIIGRAHRMGLTKKPVGFPIRQERPERKIPAMVKTSPFQPKPVVNSDPTPVPEQIGDCSVSLMLAKPDQCRAVIDGHKDENGLAIVCGKPIVGGQAFSFCSDHLQQYTTRGYYGGQRGG